MKSLEVALTKTITSVWVIGNVSMLLCCSKITYFSKIKLIQSPSSFTSFTQPLKGLTMFSCSLVLSVHTGNIYFDTPDLNIVQNEGWLGTQHSGHAKKKRPQIIKIKTVKNLATITIKLKAISISKSNVSILKRCYDWLCCIHCWTRINSSHCSCEQDKNEISPSSWMEE